MWMDDSFYSEQEEVLCGDCSSTCGDCGGVVSEGRLQEAKDNDGDIISICPSCAEENANYIMCSKCNIPTHIDHIRQDGDGDALCQECFEQSFVSCEECSEPIYKNDAIEVEETRNNVLNTLYYCEECAEEHDVKGEKHKAKGYEELTSMESVTYTSQDRILNELKKLLPIGIKELKNKHPRLAAVAKDVIKYD